MEFEKHTPYTSNFNHAEDFKVKYRFLSQEEGGRAALPYQGIRSNFFYEHDNHTLKGSFMIWPEFEDSNGKLIESGFVLKEGIARMWIVNSDMRPYHQQRILIGTKGYFMEGRQTGICEVVAIVGLMNNPVGKPL